MRCAAHGLAVAGLAALAVWQVVNLATSLPLVGLALTGIVGGALAGLARVRSPSVATFLRFAAVSAPVFLVEFVFLSTSAVLIWDGGDVGPGSRRGRIVAGDGTAPVVMVVPTSSPPRRCSTARQDRRRLCEHRPAGRRRHLVPEPHHGGGRDARGAHGHLRGATPTVRRPGRDRETGQPVHPVVRSHECTRGS
jgi:hypothetical protein